MRRVVSERIAAGDHLYRDVAFPATPLSVWITALCIKAVGSHVLVERGLIAIFHRDQRVCKLSSDAGEGRLRANFFSWVP